MGDMVAKTEKKLSLSTGCPSGRGLTRDFLEGAFSYAGSGLPQGPF